MELPSDCSDTYILRREGTGAVEGTLFPQTISRNNHGKILLQGINRTGENGDADHEEDAGDGWGTLFASQTASMLSRPRNS